MPNTNIALCECGLLKAANNNAIPLVGKMQAPEAEASHSIGQKNAVRHDSFFNGFNGFVRSGRR